MIFNKLVLNNFRSYKNGVITFDKGITIIIGENGAGKSSIFEGISFALFKMHTSQKIDNLVHNGAKKMSVELEFSHAGNDYKIIREKTKGVKSSLFKKEHDEYVLLYQGENDVQQAIQKILDMDSTLFSNAIYVRQGDIAELIIKTSSQKKSFIGKLLGLNVLEGIWKELGNIIPIYEKNLAEIKGQMTSLSNVDENYEKELESLNELKKKHQFYKKHIDEMSPKLMELEKTKIELESNFSRLIHLKNNKKQLKDEIIDLQKRQKKIEDILKEQNGIKEEINSLKKEIKSLRKYRKMKEECEELDTIKENYKGLLERISQEEKLLTELYVLCEKKYKKISYDEFNIKTFESDMENIENSWNEQMEKMTKKIEEAEYEIASCDAKINENQEFIDNLGLIDGKCPICNSKITDDKKDKLLEKYSKNIEELLKKRDSNKAALKIFKKVRDDLFKDKNVINEIKYNVDEYNKKKSQLDNIKPEMSSMKKIIEEKSLNIKDVSKEEIDEKITLLMDKKGRVFTLEGSLKNSEYFAKEIKDIVDDIDKKNEELENVIRKIEEIEFDESEYEKINSSFNSLNNDVSNSIESMNILIGTAQEKIKQIKKTIRENDTYNNLSEKYLSLSEFIELLKQIRALYSKDGIQKDLRNISKPLIQKYTKDFFNEFNFVYSDLVINEDYDISLYGPEGESSMSMVSGGEKIAVALALRLGITQAISKGGLDTILLDEPTIHLDDNRRSELIDLITKMSLIPQMIIVTHETQLENAADNLIKIKKDNGISSII